MRNDLSDHDVATIRELAPTTTQAKLAMIYGCSVSKINNVINRSCKTYEDPIAPKRPPLRPHVTDPSLLKKIVGGRA